MGGKLQPQVKQQIMYVYTVIPQCKHPRFMHTLLYAYFFLESFLVTTKLLFFEHNV
jgi:hypothetical protein